MGHFQPNQVRYYIEIRTALRIMFTLKSSTFKQTKQIQKERQPNPRGTPIAGIRTEVPKYMRYTKMFFSRPRSLMLVLALKTIWKNLREPKVAGAMVAITGAASYAAWRYKRTG